MEIEMFKLEISIAAYDWMEDKVTVETTDFDKAQIIQEFIEFQKDFGWAADYELSEDYFDCDDEEEEYDEEGEEYEEYEIGEIVEDEDGLLWKRVA
jgi:hypothetical protein